MHTVRGRVGLIAQLWRKELKNAEYLVRPEN